eukprot:COSAG02_NODE_62995_length_264_cov_0.878788_1_plen_72_part_10
MPQDDVDISRGIELRYPWLSKLRKKAKALQDKAQKESESASSHASATTKLHADVLAVTQNLAQIDQFKFAEP